MSLQVNDCVQDMAMGWGVTIAEHNGKLNHLIVPRRSRSHARGERSASGFDLGSAGCEVRVASARADRLPYNWTGFYAGGNMGIGWRLRIA